jgi:hypothetical protein
MSRVEKLRDILTQLAVTQRECARKLEIPEGIFRAYAAGKSRHIPNHVLLAMRFMLHQKTNAASQGERSEGE